MTKIFIATLLAFTASPALAEPPVTVTSTVHIADLDLSSKAGQRALDHRLSVAAKEVCGTAYDVDVAGKNDVRRCRAETLASVASDRDQRIAAASSQPIEVASR
ncbi:UrcA family protein [Sphingomonas sp. G124]|uniref:UrcA family protein n=1 Tax=Sphingomonas cremea TaxID=2904799 RepID=A0A9X1QJL6_9SPHN|nr:UrcA family protein [Sphingomonas cremea]MCF2513749.1 UrcA family protein [Sphingomonas cremea]